MMTRHERRSEQTGICWFSDAWLTCKPPAGVNDAAVNEAIL